MRLRRESNEMKNEVLRKTSSAERNRVQEGEPGPVLDQLDPSTDAPVWILVNFV